MKYNNAIKNKAITLHENGECPFRISKILNISRSTIRYWLENKDKPIKEKFNPKQLLEEQKESYSYCLGLYLGDGYICKTRRTYRLRIFQTAKYKNLVRLCQHNLKTILPNNKISLVDKKCNCTVISVYNNDLPLMFPQHGSGKKHERKISLKNWQKKIVDLYPKEFIKGLIHSDGCRYKRTVGKYTYTNYNFVNKSKDIIYLLCKYCEKLKIKYDLIHRNNNTDMVNFSRRDSVKILDSFIGEKS
jgi:intein-encoded DNA endonuclease-like protein